MSAAAGGHKADATATGTLHSQQGPGGAVGGASAAATSMSPPVSTMPCPPATTATEDEDESEDESEILEESPCGRWQKRREEVREVTQVGGVGEGI